MKSWKVQLVDDGLEENHETFTVTLTTPHNAVLGQQSSASVEILDPRGGGPAGDLDLDPIRVGAGGWPVGDLDLHLGPV